ncbi:hypothetical protein FACS1894199_05540 [Bacteroidia bacterium]|nr:hypothetical protein FACS1894199_05540 [Bacteroidia bacterium]
MGCSGHQEKDPLTCFKSEPVKLVPTIISTDKPVLFGGVVALMEDTILAINTLKEDTLLTFINVLNGKTLKRMVSKGNGPGEMHMIKFCKQTNNNQLWLYDPNSAKLHFIDHQVIMTDALYKTTNFQQSSQNLLKIDTCFISSGIFVKNYRFQLFDSNGKTFNTCLNYQKSEKYQNMSDHTYSTGFQGIYTIHPDNNKFAFATILSGSIQIFDFVNNVIQPKIDLFFYEPVMKEQNGVCAFSRQSKRGFDGIESTQQFIYTLYSNKILADPDLTCSHLLVFDWDGNPIKRYLLDTPLTTFCINSQGTKLYGIAFMPETTIVQYDLQL